MFLSEMVKLANKSGLAKSDAQWWPKWMEAYARSVHQVDAPRIDISRESLISLLRRMRDSGKSAWVRLQVVGTNYHQPKQHRWACPRSHWSPDFWARQSMHHRRRYAKFRAATRVILLFTHRSMRESRLFSPARFCTIFEPLKRYDS